MYESVEICKQFIAQWFPRDSQQRELPPSLPVLKPGQSGKQILNSSPASLLLPGRFFFIPELLTGVRYPSVFIKKGKLDSGTNIANEQ